MKTFTVTLNDEQLETLASIMETRKGRSEASIVTQIVERGLYALAYRTERNRRVYAENAEVRKELKALKASLRD